MTFSSGSNVENCALIAGFPQTRGGWTSLLILRLLRQVTSGGWIRVVHTTDRKRQRQGGTGFYTTTTYLLLMCAGELVARVTFSINFAGSLSQWVKYELGKHTAASSSSLHIWSRNHLAKKAWLIWKKSFISKLAWGLGNLGGIYFVRFEKECCFFSSKDPPSKENPYEDIELERSCLGSKCVSPSSSSPVPCTPTKVAALTLSTLKKKTRFCINTTF